MVNESGIWFTAPEFAKDEIESSIERQESFSLNVHKGLIKPRRVEMIAVSIDGLYLSYLGLCRRGRRSATGDITLQVTHLKAIEDMELDWMESELPSSVARFFKPSEVGARRVSLGLWRELLAILDRQAAAASAIGPIASLIEEANRSIPRRQRDLEIFERDAIGCAVQTWGGQGLRKRVLRSATIAEEDEAPYFITRLRNAPMREDAQVNHDAFNFPGMENVRADIVGTVTLSNRNQRLTIFNCNRMPLEQTLGVDLIYYNHVYDSFVLVQYKRMTKDTQGGGEEEGDEDDFGEDASLAYRPHLDKSLQKEMVRIDSTMKELKKIGSAAGVLNAYRLDERPFYLKLCPERSFRPVDEEMVKGMYIPFELWTQLISSTHVKGERGGVRITWDNCKRRFSNTEFTSLLASGWIGSTSGQSVFLADIIHQTLSEGKMVIVAGTSGQRSQQGYRRDSWGRFTDQDDAFGSY